MTDLKTTREDLKGLGKTGMDFRKDVLHDALHAHTLEARIDKVMAMKIPPPMSLGDARDKILKAGGKRTLKYIQAILGGEK